ncbi:MAG TPA: hypothetical protein VKM55_13765 [Candidatus Lokiarchaeia archaeon]|nr:hypothetical protein [Candidatus Lokiarchaeia archaeon]
MAGLASSSFFFKIDRKIELYLKIYVDLNKNQEIAGGLIGDIKGVKGKGIVFDIKSFLPFPNLASDKRNFSDIPKLWFEILDEWRIFQHPKQKFIGFLHSHPLNSSKISTQDKEFANSLREKYGTIVFIIIGENKTLRCYLFKNEEPVLIGGKNNYYKCLLR